MNPSDLQELGLTEQEAKIYLSLITLGKASASQISTEARVSYGTIYDVLSHMERKGLVKTVPEKTKKFVATPPEKLLALVQERNRKLAQIQESIRDLKVRYEQEPATPILVAQGKANFYKLKAEMTPHSIRDYSLRPVFEYRPESWRKMRERKAKKVDYRILYGPNAKKENIGRYAKEKIPLAPCPIDNVILSIHDNETLITLLKKNTTILVRDKDFTDLLAWFFLWVSYKS